MRFYLIVMREHFTHLCCRPPIWEGGTFNLVTSLLEWKGLNISRTIYLFGTIALCNIVTLKIVATCFLAVALVTSFVFHGLPPFYKSILRAPSNMLSTLSSKASVSPHRELRREASHTSFSFPFLLSPSLSQAFCIASDECQQSFAFSFGWELRRIYR